MIQDVDAPNSANPPSRLSMGLRLPLTWQQTLLAVALGIVGVGSGLTNPSRTAYEAHATEQASSFLLKEVCRQNLRGPQVLTQALQQGCESLSQGSRKDLHKFIQQNTEHYNFCLFSLYTTELPGYQLRTLGLWHNFIIISVS